MLAVVKTPHIDLKIEGEIPKELLLILKQTWQDELELTDNETQPLGDDAWYQNETASFTPAERLRSAREMMDWTIQITCY